MKMVRMALLGGAALAVTASGAFAEDIDALKAQLEALNARVAQLETAPVVSPQGYSLMKIYKGKATKVMGLDEIDRNYADTATIIGVVPAADAAPTTTIEWSGYVREIVSTFDNDVDYDDPFLADFSTSDDVEFQTRAQLKVVGTTDTAVGQVGVRIQMRATDFDFANQNLVVNEAWGWWQATPELNFAGGWTGTLGNVGFGVDGACTCHSTDNSLAFGIFNPGDTEQLRFTWNNGGPLTFAVAAEEGQNGDNVAAASKISYASDAFNAAISGKFDDDDWQASVGIGLPLGDMFALSMAATFGEDDRFASGAPGVVIGEADFWAVSGLASMSLTDQFRAEMGGAYTDIDGQFGDIQQWAVLGGLYYEPVAQLTFGVEAEWASAELDDQDGAAPDSDATSEQFYAGFVAVWKF